MRFLLSLALLFQNVVNGPTTINGPSMLATGLGSSTPAFQSSCISGTGATLNCQLSTVPSGAKILIQLEDNTNTTALTAARICPGTTSCSSSTDTLVNDVVMTHTANHTDAAWSDCQASGTLTGSVMVTIVVSGHSSPRIFAEVYTGGATSSCFDQSGITQVTGANASISTSGNVAAANEVAISVIGSATAITAGTTGLCTGGTCTKQQFTGGQGMETSTTSPTNGTVATMSWTNTAGTWAGGTYTYK